eukprot:jgi/Ulvmu1/11155/UM071_0039.1
MPLASLTSLDVVLDPCGPIDSVIASLSLSLSQYTHAAAAPVLLLNLKDFQYQRAHDKASTKVPVEDCINSFLPLIKAPALTSMTYTTYSDTVTTSFPALNAALGQLMSLQKLTIDSEMRDLRGSHLRRCLTAEELPELRVVELTSARCPTCAATCTGLC